MKKLMKSLSLTLVLVSLLTCLPLISAGAVAPSYTPSSSYQSGTYYKNLLALQLTGDQRTDMVAVARSQVGYTESNSSSKLSGSTNGSSNYTEYGKFCGDTNMLWCGAFVNWCASQAGISRSVVPDTVYTPSGVNKFIGWGRAYTPQQVKSGVYTPRPGDLIFFKYSRNNNIVNHVGIVSHYSSDNKIYTIEGNTTPSGGSSNGGGVYEKSYSITYSAIRYICSPNYSGSDNYSGPDFKEEPVPPQNCFPACSSNHTSIVSALKSVGADGSYAYRKTIAAANDIANYSGSAAQNTQMLRLLKAGKLKKPGNSNQVPDAACFPACSSNHTSIVSALKSVGADGSYSYRKTIAAANDIANYSGSAAQNTQMLRLLKAGKLKKPGSSNQVPDAACFPACSSNHTSIVSALKSVGADGSYSYRKTIAAANDIANYSGSAAQNTQMLRLLKAGKLVKP